MKKHLMATKQEYYPRIVNELKPHCVNCTLENYITQSFCTVQGREIIIHSVDGMLDSAGIELSFLGNLKL